MAEPPKVVEFKSKKAKAEEVDEIHQRGIQEALEALRMDLTGDGVDSLFLAWVPAGEPEDAVSLFSLSAASNSHALFVVLSLAIDELKVIMREREEVNLGYDPDEGLPPSG